MADAAFRYSVEIGDFKGQTFRPIDALVNTGATYTSIPAPILDELGISRDEERPFVLANGDEVRLGVGWVRVRLESREQPTLVIFRPAGSQPLLGAFTLEGFGLSVDPVNKRLVPVSGFLVGVVQHGA